MTKKNNVVIEGVMETTATMAKEPIITLKELFERLVQVETKLDMKTANDMIVAKRFKSFTLIIILVEVVNFIFNFFILSILKQVI